jgi:hypothetical protein
MGSELYLSTNITIKSGMYVKAFAKGEVEYSEFCKPWSITCDPL